MKDVERTIISQYDQSSAIVQLIQGMNENLDQSANFASFYDFVWNVETAQDWGLDIWGRIVDISRYIKIPKEVDSFGFHNDTDDTDFNPFNTFPFYPGAGANDTYRLADNAYRILILAKALSNISATTAQAINQVLKNLFIERGKAWVEDHNDMTMTYVFDFKLESFERVIVTTSNVLPKPAGVLMLPIVELTHLSIISINPLNAYQIEGDVGVTIFTFEITRTGLNLSATSTVDYIVTGYGDSAADAADFEGGVFPSGTITFAPGEYEPQILEINVQGDINIEADDQFLVTLTNPQECEIGTATAIGTILNDDFGYLNIYAIDANKDEGDTGATIFTFAVERTGNILGYSSANWTVSGYGANPANAQDFVGGVFPSGLVEFETTREAAFAINIEVQGDTVYEQDEQFVVTLSRPVGCILQQTTAIGTIINDDVMPPSMVSISATDANKNEGDTGTTVFTFAVTRVGATIESSVAWAVTGTGTHPADAQDFVGGVLPGGSLTFAIAETTKTINVNAQGDTVVEQDETFLVTLSNPVGCQIDVATAIGTILNDDAYPTLAIVKTIGDLPEGDVGETSTHVFTVTRSGNLSMTSAVNYAVTGSGANPANAQDFVGSVLPSGVVNFAINDTTKTININVQGDAEPEPDEQFTVTLSAAVNASITTASATSIIIDDDSIVAPEIGWVGNAFVFSTNADVPLPPAGTYSDGDVVVILIRTGNRTVNTPVGWTALLRASYGVVNNDSSSGLNVFTLPVSGTLAATQRVTVTTSGNSMAVAFLIINTASHIPAQEEGIGVASGLAGMSLLTVNMAAKSMLLLTAGSSYSIVSSEMFSWDANAVERLDHCEAAKGGGLGIATVHTDTNIAPTPSCWVAATSGWSATLSGYEFLGTITTKNTYLGIVATDADKNEGNSGSTPFTFTVNRSGLLTVISGVNWAVSGYGANPASADDFVGGVFPSGALSFTSGVTSHVITVNVQGDLLIENDEEFIVTLSAATNAIITSATATGIIRNDDTLILPVVSLTGNVSHLEGNSGTTPFVFVVSRTGDTTGTSSVNWTVTGSGTHPADAQDFVGGTLPAGSISFSAGVNTKDIIVNVQGDVTVENDETFTVTLSAPSGATIGTATAIGTILNDDSAVLPTLAIAATSANKNEGDSGSTPFTFTVTRAGDTTGTSSAAWAVTGTGANPANAADFVGGILPSGTVSFAAADTAKVITVNVQGDTDVENDETFTVTLSSPSNATIITATAIGTILNDDSYPTLAINLIDGNKFEGNTGDISTHTFTVIRSGNLSMASSVNWATTGSGANPADAADFVGGVLPSGSLNFAISDTSKDIIVQVSGDNTVEPDEEFTVTLSVPINASITTATATSMILNDDIVLPTLAIEATDATKPEGDTGSTPFTFTVTRAGDTTDTSSVHWAVSGISADANDFVGGILPSGTLNFAISDTSKLITVNVQGDNVVEPDETFAVNLSNPVNATITTATAIGTILNDDIAAVDVPPLFVGTSTVGVSGGTNLNMPYPASGEYQDGDLLIMFVHMTNTVVNDISADGWNLIGRNGSGTVGNNGAVGMTAWSKVVSGTLPATQVLVQSVGQDWAGVMAVIRDQGTLPVPFTNTPINIANGSAGYEFGAVTVDNVNDMLLYLVANTYTNAAVSNMFTWNALITETLEWNPDQVSCSLGIATRIPGKLNVPSSENSGSTDALSTSPVCILMLDIPCSTGGAALPVISMTNDVAQNEGDSGATPFTFTVTRSGDTTGASIAEWAVTGTGTYPANAQDFVGGVLPSGTVSFAPSDTSHNILVNVQGDTTVEQNETFLVTLSLPVNATIGIASALGTIINDDTTQQGPVIESVTFSDNTATTVFALAVADVVCQGQFQYGLTTAYGTLSKKESSFNYSTHGQTLDNLTPNSFYHAQFIATDQQGFTTYSNDTTFSTLSDTVVSIAATSASKNEGDNGATPFTFTVTRSGTLTGTSSVSWAVTGSDANPANAVDFVGGVLPSGSVSFAASDTSKVITVNVQGDPTPEANETFTVTLSNPVGASIGTASAVGTIIDDDTVGGGTYPPQGAWADSSIQTIAKQALYTPFQPTEFQTKIIRVTNNLAHHYSKDGVWNSDQSLMKFSGGVLINGTTYQPVRTISSPPNEMVWSNTDPNKLFGISGNSFVSVNATTSARTTLRTFTGFTNIYMGPDEGSQDKNDGYVCFTTSLDTFAGSCILYNIANNTFISKLWTAMGFSAGTRLDWVSISQGGGFVVVAPYQGDENVKTFDLNLNLVKDLGIRVEHADLGIDTSGNEVLVQAGAGSQQPLMINLLTGLNTRLINIGYNVPGHCSCRNLNRPGYAYFSNDNNQNFQIISIKLDGSGLVENYAHHRSSATVYATQTKVCASRDGLRVVWNSDWQGTGATGGSSVDAYVAGMNP